MCSCMHAGPWEGSVERFAECGFQCPVFKNPTDYYMAVASDPENHAALLAEEGRLTESIANAASETAAAKPNEVIREVRPHL